MTRNRDALAPTARGISAGPLVLAAIAAIVLTPAPASAALPYDPQVLMFTYVSSGMEYFTSTYNDGGMSAVTRLVNGCYTYNDRPGWMGRFITCNAEDDSAYLYSRYLLRARGIPSLPYFTRSAFQQRQNAVLATYGMPPSQRPAWIQNMLHRVNSLLQLKIRGGSIGVQP